MKKFVICFESTGGISVEAESEEEAIKYFDSQDGQEEVRNAFEVNGIDITEIFEV